MDINRGLYEAQKLKITARVSEVMDSAVSSAFAEMDQTAIAFMRRLYGGRRDRALKGGRLRDIMTILAFDICGIKEINENHLKVIAAGELYNMASYYQNWHLDGKKEVKSEEEKKLCHISSHFFRELAAELIMDTSFNGEAKLLLLKEISESNKAVQVGQALELDGLNYGEPSTVDEQELYQSYLRRCSLIAGRFYGASFSFAPIIAQKDHQTVELFRDIGYKLGITLQVINDVGDFCMNREISKTPDKDYQDQFADLEKGTLTLPIYELSKVLNIKKYSGRKLKENEKKKILRIMVKNRCFDSSRSTTNHLKNIIMRDLSKLGKGESVGMLKFIIKIFCTSSKFYVNLREEHGYRWGGQQPLSDVQRGLIGKLI
jgi:geranylgeranyl pyrophosphate synthase